MKIPINQIIQGDCLEVLKTFPDNSVDLVVTSPPYNKASANRKCSKTDSWSKANINYGEFKDDLPEPEYQERQKQVIRELVRIIKPSGSIFYNHKYRIKNHRVISPEQWLGEFIIRQVVIWDRTNSPMMEPIRFMPKTEQLYWITKEQKTPYFTRDGFQFHDIWRIPPAKNPHPAPFPEEIVKRCIIAACPENGVVLDPYMGSGTTAKVAREMGRDFVGIELNLEFIKMAENKLSIPLQESLLSTNSPEGEKE